VPRQPRLRQVDVRRGRLRPEVVGHAPLEEDGRLEDERGAASELERVEAP